MLVIIIFFKLKFDRQTESEKCFIMLAYSVLAAGGKFHRRTGD